MIAGQRVLGVIPARGGSKRVPGKNVRKVRGKPLIAWAIEEAQKSRHIDRLVLSSDDPAIIEAAKACGCEVPFVRPAALAQDDTPGVAPVLHALAMLPGYDLVVLLQATSPLRRAEDIDGCIERCAASNGACVSVAKVEKSPYWMYFLDERGCMVPILGGETAARDVYILNGAVYVARTDWLKKTQTFVTPETLAYVMPAGRSLDVDTELDLKFFDALLEDAQA